MSDRRRRSRGSINTDLSLKTRLLDALEFLRDAYRVPLHIDWQSLRANKIDPNTEVALKLSQIPLGDLLHWVLLEAGGDKPLSFTARNGEVFVGVGEP